MKLHRMMAPAILRAEQGFTVNPALARIIMEHVSDIMQNDALAKILCPDGLPLEAGDILKNPDLALTLRLIAAYGPDLFYRGELADAIAKANAVVTVTPYSVTYDGAAHTATGTATGAGPALTV